MLGADVSPHPAVVSRASMCGATDFIVTGPEGTIDVKALEERDKWVAILTCPHNYGTKELKRGDFTEVVIRALEVRDTGIASGPVHIPGAPFRWTPEWEFDRSYRALTSDGELRALRFSGGYLLTFTDISTDEVLTPCAWFADLKELQAKALSVVAKRREEAKTNPKRIGVLCQGQRHEFRVSSYPDIVAICRVGAATFLLVPEDVVNPENPRVRVDFRRDSDPRGTYTTIDVLGLFDGHNIKWDEQVINPGDPISTRSSAMGAMGVVRDERNERGSGSAPCRRQVKKHEPSAPQGPLPEPMKHAVTEYANAMAEIEGQGRAIRAKLPGVFERCAEKGTRVHARGNKKFRKALVEVSGIEIPGCERAFSYAMTMYQKDPTGLIRREGNELVGAFDELRDSQAEVSRAMRQWFPDSTREREPTQEREPAPDREPPPADGNGPTVTSGAAPPAPPPRTVGDTPQGPKPAQPPVPSTPLQETTKVPGTPACAASASERAELEAKLAIFKADSDPNGSPGGEARFITGYKQTYHQTPIDTMERMLGLQPPQDPEDPEKKDTS